ncbi:shikimate kinase [Paracoccus sulfuroxidans]|uniref:Shikimate kinase n=1 Tax=Paracoccus sulfuroxidans TaxID=384678 RepID=A0A562NFI4_9RHOB|nr:shikimate kinase [Paracoccus sulfuroxidans]TWI30959.1 shikimate kinase [Paracoccus sulfuroxidans]
MIVLLGMPGCGKSTLAQALAVETGVPWYDTDACLQDQHGNVLGPRPGPEQWRRFRELEHALIRDLAQEPAGCLSLGGGAWQSAETRRVLLARHICIYLRCDLDELAERLKHGGRVMFAGGDIRQQLIGLLQQREPEYRLAHHTVDITNRHSTDLLALLHCLRG